MGAFKLEKAIQIWLKTFQKHQAFDEGNLQEAEVHLRDHIDDLIGDGLSEQDAFDRAVASFGDQREVAKEEFWNQQRPPSIRRFIFAAMVRNYYRTSVRTLLRNPLSSFINVFGLAVAIGACMVVYSAFEFDGSIDQFHANKNEVFLSTHYVDRGGKLEQYGTAPIPLGPSMLQDLAGIAAMSRVADQSAIVKVGSEVYHESVRMVDPQFLDMFTFPMERGAHYTLADPGNVVLSSAMAEKYFGNNDPIGKDLEIIFPNQEQRIYQVTGVAKAFPDARTIDFDFLVNFESISSARPGLRSDDWSELIT
ncbi:MAG: ABC transporter permease, partial [Bacteroidota bacterium]